ncbi:CIA30 family protein [Halomonas sp. HAL1]|uniref:CIA30 family protein n=1 Tax=Halomonas sp. HAL1 TaxID=550984 RepID=UPI00022D2BE3|nr:CIA30 family protein [Halomonas sp. HAL1]EHA13771.1 putative exonuclease [Halomonas sp. HAL1]WKV93577.1 CIA30 family protein [Halomonas sp. HAL1]
MALTFDSPNEQQRWYAVDDGVMGGVSKSGFCVSDGVGRFQGEVSLENGGGFASVRREPNGFEPTLADAQGIALTVRGDGRTYQLRLKSTSLGDASAYRVKFTPAQDSWETLHFPWSAFEAVRRGTLLSYAPAVTPSEIHQLGFLIADRTAGPFCLQIKRIEPMR